MKTPTPPNHLSLKAQALWTQIHKQFDLEPEARELLRIALENMDLGDRARALLRDEGLIVDGKKHPAADLAKQHDSMCLRTFRQLALDVIAPAAPAGKRA